MYLFEWWFWTMGNKSLLTGKKHVYYIYFHVLTGVNIKTTLPPYSTLQVGSGTHKHTRTHTDSMPYDEDIRRTEYS